MADQILAPMAGKIVAVQIKAGDKVEEDDTAMVIEAMKMETEVFVPCDGTVKEVLVKEGAMVEEEDVLAVIE